jgi:hypothetical protein
MYADFRFELGDKVRVTEEYIATQDERAPKWASDMRLVQKVKPGEVVAMTLSRKGVHVTVEFTPNMKLNFVQSALMLV